MNIGRRCLLLFIALAVLAQTKAQTVEESDLEMLTWTDIEILTEGSITLPARLYTPPRRNPESLLPAIVLMHGSGGMWAQDRPGPEERLVRHLEEWAALLLQQNIVVLAPDSFTPRGLVEFRQKKPAEDSSVDNSKASPTHVRPRDAFTALRYLRQLPFVDPARIGIIGFSHGAEAALVSMLDPSIDRTPWKQAYTWLDESKSQVEVSPPPRPPPEGSFIMCVAYYPGCGFYDFFGRVDLPATVGQYMPSAPTLVIHGSADPLAAYAPLLEDRSWIHASTQKGLRENPVTRSTFPQATHSFDAVNLNKPSDTRELSVNKRVKLQAREVALRFVSKTLLASGTVPWWACFLFIGLAVAFSIGAAHGIVLLFNKYLQPRL